MFSAKFISDALLGKQTGLSDLTRVWTDSRTTKAGDLFAAIKGENFNGHDFVFNAYESGAKAALISDNEFKNHDKLPKDFCLIRVEDTIQALRQLAHAYRSKLKIPFFAVAGSNGKTTTKEWIAHFLSQLYKKEEVFKTLKSQNSILGIALSILQIRDEKMAIIEIGIDEPGWMEQHLKLIRPSHGIITTISEEHLEHLKSIETVAEEELKLLQYLADNEGAFAANFDSTWIKESELPKNSVTYGLESPANIEGKFSSPSTLHAFGIKWTSSLPGKHNAQNLLAALASVQTMLPNLSRAQIQSLQNSCSSFKGEDHRSCWLDFSNGISVYDDAYNANPSSMEFALKSFYELCKDRPKVLVLGGMLDLGESSKKSHLQTLSLLKELEFEAAYLLGEEFSRALKALKLPNVKAFNDFDSLKAAALSDIQSSHAVFLKGSRSMALERLIPEIEKI